MIDEGFVNACMHMGYDLEAHMYDDVIRDASEVYSQ